MSQPLLRMSPLHVKDPPLLHHLIEISCVLLKLMVWWSPDRELHGQRFLTSLVLVALLRWSVSWRFWVVWLIINWLPGWHSGLRGPTSWKSTKFSNFIFFAQSIRLFLLFNMVWQPLLPCDNGKYVWQGYKGEPIVARAASAVTSLHSTSKLVSTNHSLFSIFGVHYQPLRP